MIDGAHSEEARAAGRAMPERLLPGTARRRQPGVGGTEQGHHGHADGGGDVRGSTVRRNERVQLREERRQERRTVATDETPDWSRRRRLDRVGKPPCLRASKKDRADTARLEPSRQLGDPLGGPELRGTKRCPELESDPWVSRRQPGLSEQAPRLHATRRVDGQGRREQPCLHAKGREQPKVSRHLVDRAGVRPDRVRQQGAPPTPVADAPPCSAQPSGQRSLERVREDQGEVDTHLSEAASLREPGTHASGRDETSRDARLTVQDGPYPGSETPDLRPRKGAPQ